MNPFRNKSPETLAEQWLTHLRDGQDVVRVDDPEFRHPLIIGTTARELTSQEMRLGYGCRWPVETNFYAA